MTAIKAQYSRIILEQIIPERHSRESGSLVKPLDPRFCGNDKMLQSVLRSTTATDGGNAKRL